MMDKKKKGGETILLHVHTTQGLPRHLGTKAC